MPWNSPTLTLTPAITISQGATINPASGAQDFSTPFTYTVTAYNGLQQQWTVTVTRVQSTANDILTFSLAEQATPAVIDVFNHTVSIVVNYGTDLSLLTPDITVSSFATINPASGDARDFTGPVTYMVTAYNGSQQQWTVTVSTAPSPENNIVTFSLAAQTAPAVINTTNHTINVEVSYGTALTSLTPVITVSDGATITPSGAQNFATPFTYTVTAANGTAQTWTVTVTAAPSPENDIVTFSLAAETAPAVINTTNHTINVEVSYGTILTALTPVITTSAGATINPPSGAQNFSAPFIYTVTAANGTAQAWIVIVTTAPNTENDIVSFSLAEETAPAVINTTDHTVSITVNYGTDLTALVPAITVSPFATISPAIGVAQNFTTPVTYTVTAQNGSIATYLVTVTVGNPPCITPSDVAVSNITAISAEIAWTSTGGNEIAWQVAWKETANSTWNYAGATAIPYTIQGLTIDTDYDVQIRAICGIGDTSNWSDAAQFTTFCANPTDVVATTITTNSITITWEPVNGETDWTVSWKNVATGEAGSGDAHGNDYNGYSIIELNDSTEYRICVTALCTQGVSDANCITAVTLDDGTGIPDITLSKNLQLYPNPTTGELRIKNYELREGDKIEIYNTLGQKQQLNTSNYPLNTIDVSHLSAGIYTLKIGGHTGKFVKQQN
jgi:hypothetical protein